MTGNNMLAIYETKNRIGYITLNRTDKKNALNHQMVTALLAAFERAEADDNVKVIILRAQGDVFCAGVDLEYLQQLQTNSYQENLEDSNHLKDLLLKIYTLNKVVIAQVQGHAIAGGAGLASVCDFSFAVPEAKFGYSEVKIGFIPAIVMIFLLRKVGEQTARSLLLSGRLISAEEAVSAKLINQVVPAVNLETAVQLFADKLILNNSAQSMSSIKNMMVDIPSMSLLEALDHAVAMNAKTRSTEDCQKGISAFLNKEKLSW